jgi:hypothetical protein
MKNPQGSVAVITGANRELGAGMAKRFEQPDEVGIVRPLNPGTDLTGYCVGVASDRAGRRAIRRRSAAESVAVATVYVKNKLGARGPASAATARERRVQFVPRHRAQNTALSDSQNLTISAVLVRPHAISGRAQRSPISPEGVSPLQRPGVAAAIPMTDAGIAHGSRVCDNLPVASGLFRRSLNRFRDWGIAQLREVARCS